MKINSDYLALFISIFPFMKFKKEGHELGGSELEFWSFLVLCGLGKWLNCCVSRLCRWMMVLIFLVSSEEEIRSYM